MRNGTFGSSTVWYQIWKSLGSHWTKDFSYFEDFAGALFCQFEVKCYLDL